ncbi:MAG: DNA helicase RecQ [Planctomycetota bacterium]
MNFDDSQIEARLSTAIKKFWGYDSFRPQQLAAMTAVIKDQDSLAVFPTGAGKSLCFQAPAVCRDGLAVVVSPLISLMKDQVDSLKVSGIEAAFLNSSLSRQEEAETVQRALKGELKLLYMAPERLLTDDTHRWLDDARLSFFAIDEAHCVSQWGHDFRPEYRQLATLKQRFPNVAVHGYTATATAKVREDIVKQLAQVNSQVLVGSMDRPNLIYRITRRETGIDQLVDVIQRHPGESGIVYCISRKEVESVSATLRQIGITALPYHAGMSVDQRKGNQDAFLREEALVIVATVAFGMGIDKSNVRFVIHSGMPKSLEAYQQESGRAGRDGLEAECSLFYRAGDYMTWSRMLEQSDGDSGKEGAQLALKAIADFCNGTRCRHVELAAYFGETLDIDDCGACDVCLNQLPLVADPLILGQKIVSCVYRVDQRFGADYVAQVLSGSRDKRILQNGHEKVSTYGLLSDESKRDIRDWIEQLISQDFLARVGEYNTLQITDTGRQLLRGERSPRLLKPQQGSTRSKSSQQSLASWEGVDRELFEKLKSWRSKFATEQQVPSYVVFNDASLRDMARRRPSTLASFRSINGVGQKKLADYGEAFLEIITMHCQQNECATDVQPSPSTIAPATKSKLPTQSAFAAFEHIEAGVPIAEIANRLGRAEATTYGYLNDYIVYKKIIDYTPWVDSEIGSRIEAAIETVGLGPLKPIFIALDEEVDYNSIRIVQACVANR